MVPEVHISQIQKPIVDYIAPISADVERYVGDWRQLLLDLVPDGTFLSKEVGGCPIIDPHIGTCKIILTDEDKGNGRLEIRTKGKIARFNLTTFGRSFGMTDSEIEDVAQSRWIQPDMVSGDYLTTEMVFYISSGSVSIPVSEIDPNENVIIPLDENMSLAIANNICVNPKQLQDVYDSEKRVAQVKTQVGYIFGGVLVVIAGTVGVRKGIRKINCFIHPASAYSGVDLVSKGDRQDDYDNRICSTAVGSFRRVDVGVVLGREDLNYWRNLQEAGVLDRLNNMFSFNRRLYPTDPDYALNQLENSLVPTPVIETGVKRDIFRHFAKKVGSSRELRL